MRSGRWAGRIGGLAVAATVGYLIGTADGRPAPELRAATSPAGDAAADRVFELRTYTSAEGRHDALLARFREHTLRLFEKHGMENVGYWIPQDESLADNTLVYLLAHESREAAAASWEAFIADPEWQEVFQASRADGPLISGLESVFLDPTDFSPLR
jgi:hypothetical protein